MYLPVVAVQRYNRPALEDEFEADRVRRDTIRNSTNNREQSLYHWQNKLSSARSECSSLHGTIQRNRAAITELVPRHQELLDQKTTTYNCQNALVRATNAAKLLPEARSLASVADHVAVILGALEASPTVIHHLGGVDTQRLRIVSAEVRSLRRFRHMRRILGCIVFVIVCLILFG